MSGSGRSQGQDDGIFHPGRPVTGQTRSATATSPEVMQPQTFRGRKRTKDSSNLLIGSNVGPSSFHPTNTVPPFPHIHARGGRGNSRSDMGLGWGVSQAPRTEREGFTRMSLPKEGGNTPKH